MPCYSTYTVTKILEVNRLMEALKALKIQATKVSDLHVRTAIGDFTRSGVKSAFIFNGTNMGLVGREYAKLSAKAFAQKKNFGIQSQKEKEMVLIKR